MCLVSVLMPCLNEVAYIEQAVRTIQKSASPYEHEIIVIDGGSTDGTLEKLNELAIEFSNIRVLHNPRRLQSAGVNLGAEASSASSTVLIRADCHAIYPDDFISCCVSALHRNDADSVVVPLVAIGQVSTQSAIAAAQNGVLGNGSSRHRSKGSSGFVEHGHHAAFKKKFFLQIGGYDASFSHNEDAELDYRIVKAGGKIWLESEGVVGYIPRRTLKALALQYFNHGSGRARTMMTHQMRPKIRQMVPLIAVAVSLASILMSYDKPALLILPTIYLCALLAVAVKNVISRKRIVMLWVAPALLVIQWAWAFGFVRGVVGHAWGARAPDRNFNPQVRSEVL